MVASINEGAPAVGYCRKPPPPPIKIYLARGPELTLNDNKGSVWNNNLLISTHFGILFL
jgi:hypothetical protein